MLCGAHESVKGGLHLAMERAKLDGCRALQIFTKNSNMWKEPVLDKDQVKLFCDARAEFSGGVMAHTSYLINLAARDAQILAKSVDALEAEVVRSSDLGVDFVVLHPGAHLGIGEDEGLARVIEALDVVHARTDGASARILLENTAGQGTCLGHTFEHLGEIFLRANAADRMGVCFDTQHAHAAGYDATTAEGYAKTWAEFDAKVGLSRLRAFHLNDSKKPLGGRVDRHERIGEGNLGLSYFWRLLHDPRFAALPGVLETEPDEGERAHAREVTLLARIATGPEPPAPSLAPFALEPSPPASKRRR
jgi:deoxyribonuclease-4